jgi:hypothetical protein
MVVDPTLLTIIRKKVSTKEPGILNTHTHTSTTHQPTHSPWPLPSPTTTHYVIYPFPFTIFGRHIYHKNKRKKKGMSNIVCNSIIQAIMLAPMTNFCWLKSMNDLHHTSCTWCIGTSWWVCVHSEDCLTNKEWVYELLFSFSKKSYFYILYIIYIYI